MEGVSSFNHNVDFSDNAASNVNTVSRTLVPSVQKNIPSSNDTLLKSSANISTSPIDIYDGYIEKKNDLVAVVVANTRHTDKRPSGAIIGAAFGLMQTMAFSGVYLLAKAFPILKKSKVINYFANRIDSWIKIAKELHPERTMLRNIFTGVSMKSLYLIGSGFLIGLAADIYKKIRLTNVNGRLSTNKQGNLGDNSFVAAINSLNATDSGKNVIKNSIYKNDDKSVTVYFKGIDRAYNISKEEMKEASKAYYSVSDSEGKVKSFKKKYCKGDGDLLAFELAYEKFVNDVQTGNIIKKINDPIFVYNAFISDDGRINNCSVEQGYYLLTGMVTNSINLNNSEKNHVQNISKKISLSRELLKLSLGNNDYSPVIKLKPDEDEHAILFDKHNKRKRLNSDNFYVIKDINDGCAILVNSSVSKEKVSIPVFQLKNHISEMYTINTSK